MKHRLAGRDLLLGRPENLRQSWLRIRKRKVANAEIRLFGSGLIQPYPSGPFERGSDYLVTLSKDGKKATGTT
ncbi:MAG: hypothetical protein O9333_04225, partial [Beijerinckiaceae bacterium]|nr:hypothetical protein [Beijerinckiaceae bacterium]